VDELRVDITGQRYGRLTAIERVGKSETSGRKAIWRFRCDCGEIVDRISDRVSHGFVHSCGCLGIESRLKHGQSQTRAYHREKHKEWSLRNPAKCIENANKRRADYRLRIPSWLSETDRAKIDAIYVEAARITFESGISHHVDHILPLRGKTVSGLHVPGNLQILSATENLRKSRKLPDDVC
jgi:hypothetical protein